MSKEEIIKKVIEKAFNREPTGIEFMYPETIIYHHKFLKAFFGEERVERCKQCKIDNDPREFAGCHKCKYEKGWKKHAQMMVISKEPLKYLEKYI